jgi:predicted membrane channel-forming protein YqfA (hemolysin III family)
MHDTRKLDRDSKPRPLFRGWLHGLLSIFLMAFLVASLTSPTTVGTILGVSQEEQLGFIVGKLLSCGASAAYHLVDCRSKRVLRWLNILDLLMVPAAVYALVSGASASTPFWGADRHAKWVGNLQLILAVAALNALGVWLQFRTEVPGEATVRSLVVVVYFAFGTFLTYTLVTSSSSSSSTTSSSSSLPFLEAVVGPGTEGTLARLWVAQVTTYVLGFSCGKVVDDFRMHEPLCFPHHRRGYWTLHEDFHTLVLLADLFGVAIFVIAN